MSLSGGWIESFRKEVLREVVEARARERMTHEEDMRMFESLVSAMGVAGWVTRLRTGDTVWLTDLNKWATVVTPWDDGKIRMAYDGAIREWFVSENGQGFDGRIIMKELTRAEPRALPMGDIRLPDIRNMIMIDVGKEWRDVVALLKDPMDVDGVGIGDEIWSGKGHSGDDDAFVHLIFGTPSINYTGKSGEAIRVPPTINLYLTLSTPITGPESGGKRTWEIGEFVRGDVHVFKAVDVMVSLCEYEYADVASSWGVLT